MNKLVLVCAISLLCACSAGPDISPVRQQQALCLVDQGTFFLRRGDLARARAAFEVARDLGAGPAALDGLGAVAYLAGELDQAQRYFVSAWQADEGYAEALRNLALLYETRGWQADAERLYRLVLESSPADFRARNNYAAYLFDQKRADSAIRAELLRAEAIAKHPLVEDNLVKISEVAR